MSYAESLSPAVRKKAENNAILSTFFGTTVFIVINLSLMVKSGLHRACTLTCCAFVGMA